MVCVRGIISFFTLLIFTRMLGKQQLGQFTVFDYILGITIGAFAASLTVNLNSAAWPHWIGLVTWITLGILMQYISIKCKKIFSYINDEVKIVIYNGKILGDNLRKNKLTFDELLQQLRLKDIFDINEVKLAMVEVNGKISILKKEQFQSLVNSMNIPEKNKNSNEELIFNGIIIDANLSKFKLDRKWLLNELKIQGINNSVEVFYAFLDSSKNLKVYLYKENIISSKDIFK